MKRFILNAVLGMIGLAVSGTLAFAQFGHGHGGGTRMPSSGHSNTAHQTHTLPPSGGHHPATHPGQVPPHVSPPHKPPTSAYAPPNGTTKPTIAGVKPTTPPKPPTSIGSVAKPTRVPVASQTSKPGVSVVVAPVVIGGGVPSVAVLEGGAGGGQVVEVVRTESSPGASGKVTEEVSSRPKQFMRQLQVANNTDKTLKVYVQYCTPTDDGKDAWLPDAGKTKALAFEIAPGRTEPVIQGDVPVSASRVRIWAEARGQAWIDYRDKDLWLVAETGDQGRHYYEADEVDTFVFTFGA